MGQWRKDRIRAKPNEPASAANPPVGHWVSITIKKSPNEKTERTIEYPVKYGRKGNSVWIERELVQMITGYGLAARKGSWFVFSEELLKELQTAGIPCEQQVQGEDGLVAYLEGNQQLTNYLVDKIREFIIVIDNELNNDLIHVNETS